MNRAVAARIALALAATVLLSGCLHRHRQPPPSIPSGIPAPPSPRPSTRPSPRPRAPAPPIVQGEEGIASWYGPGFNGKSTSSGEIYNMYAMTAAHKTLPFGTMVRVHDLENGQSVTVRINDRGPFVQGRIIDLSYAAAQAMGMNGTALVRLELLNSNTVEAEAPPGIFAVQVGAFTVRENAERLRGAILKQFQPVTIQNFDSGRGIFYRVRVGSVNTEAQAEALAQQLRQAGFATETFVVRLN
jgi:peptidoglycan lytic transglycosylase